MRAASLPARPHDRGPRVPAGQACHGGRPRDGGPFDARSLATPRLGRCARRAARDGPLPQHAGCIQIRAYPAARPLPSRGGRGVTENLDSCGGREIRMMC
eukprot:5814753-Prymnesium_polylepis.4